MSLAVLPLAITMNAGPQIMSAIIFVTANKPLKLSAYFITGVVIAVTVGVTITYTLATVLGNSVSLGDSSDNGSLGNIIQYLLVGLLVVLSIKNYVGRETIEPPEVAWRHAKRRAQDGVHGRTAAALAVPFRLRRPDDGRDEPRAARRLPSGRRAFRRSYHPHSGASSALLPALPQAGRAGHAQGARLDEHEQLAGEHHRLHRVHLADPCIKSEGRKGERT